MAMIRATTIDDIPYLPAIERSAGEAFRYFPALAWIADDEVMSEAEHARLVSLETCWVAEDEGAELAPDRLLGFLCAEPFANADGSQELHIWELAVSSSKQAMGIGRELMLHAVEFAAGKHGNQVSYGAVTLTTFRDIVFNAPFYAGLGFAELRSEETLSERLAQVLADEVARGMPAENRCAMRLALGDSD